MRKGFCAAIIKLQIKLMIKSAIYYQHYLIPKSYPCFPNYVITIVKQSSYGLPDTFWM